MRLAGTIKRPFVWAAKRWKRLMFAYFALECLATGVGLIALVGTAPLIGLLVAILFHEAAHAYAASSLGFKWRLFHRKYKHVPYSAGVVVVEPDEGISPRYDLEIALAGLWGPSCS